MNIIYTYINLYEWKTMKLSKNSILCQGQYISKINEHHLKMVDKLWISLWCLFVYLMLKCYKPWRIDMENHLNKLWIVDFPEKKWQLFVGCAIVQQKPYSLVHQPPSCTPSDTRTTEIRLNLRNSPPEISHTLIGGWCMRSCFGDYV